MECVVYVRQSRDFTGEGEAVARQEADCLALAARRGWTVVAVHQDNDLSGSGKVRRPGFEAVMDDVQTGRARVLVAWSLDRLSRNNRDLLRLLEVGEERGLIVALVRGSEVDLSTAAGRLTASILGSVAAHEIQVKADRQRRAALQRSQLGRPPLGVRLTGYTAKGELVEEEAQVVSQIFARFSEGDSLKGVATWLNGVIPPRHGDRWNSSTVRGILVNPRYAGRAIYQGQVTGKSGGWTPLVDETTFDLVQARLSDPLRRTQRGTDRKHLGSGLYVCDVCDAIVRAWTGKRYQCRLHFTRSQTHIDNLVLKLIRGRLAMPDLRDLLQADTESSEALDVLKALQERLQLIAEDYDAGLIDGQRYAIASQKIRTQIEEIQALLTRSSRPSVFSAPDPVQAFDDASLMLQRATIATLCQVRIRPAPQWKREFDPNSVVVRWLE